MSVEKKIKFIKGKFSPEAAKEVLLNLLNQKIQFHSLQNFSSEERFGKPVPGSQKRIEELKEAKEKVVSITDKAARENLSLKVDSIIHISLE